MIGSARTELGLINERYDAPELASTRAALRAADLDYRRPYDLRHTYATFSIAAGISLFALARRMGIPVVGLRTWQVLDADGQPLPDPIPAAASPAACAVASVISLPSIAFAAA